MAGAASETNYFKYPATASDHSNLEIVPDAAIEPVGKDRPAPQSSWQHQQQQQYGQLEKNESSRVPGKEILGLSVRTFWVITISLVLVLAGAIGGGIGGGLAASGRNRDQDDSSRSAGTTGAETTETPAVTSGTGTVTRSTPTAASSLTAIAGAASPAPRDAGCPNINGTFYTPSDASGKLIAIQSDGIFSDQIFVQLCNTNYPSGAEYGNPGIYDILKMYVPSLEDCITACAYYNRQYQINEAKGVPRTGLCKSVAIVKAEGEYCYLKNGTGRNDTFGNPKGFTSAVLIS